MLHQHVRTGNADMCELNPAIVDTMTTHLGANISNHNTWSNSEIVWIPELHDKRLDSITLSFDDHLSKDDANEVNGRSERDFLRMSSSLGSTADPPFCRSQSWGMDDEFV